MTPAESRVLPLLATHLTLRAIAEQLGCKRSTAKTHAANIYKKLGVTTRGEAVARAHEAELFAELGAGDEPEEWARRRWRGTR